MLPSEDHKAGASDDEPFLKVKQVAQRLSVSLSIVYQLLDSGRLGCHRIGKGRGTIRINESDLETFLAACRRDRKEPTDPAPQVRLRHLKS